MKTVQLMPVSEVFVSVPDPRSKRHARHDLSELLTVAVCAVLCGANDFVDVALWGKSNLAWLRKFLKLKAGAPSHDTFCRVLAMIDPAAFEAAFLRWVGVLVPALAPGSVVAIDGKTSRRSGGKEMSGPSANAPSTARPASSAITTSVPCPQMPPESRRPCVAIGRSKISFTGRSMCSSTMISPVCAEAMRPTTSWCCATSY